MPEWFRHVGKYGLQYIGQCQQVFLSVQICMGNLVQSGIIKVTCVHYIHLVQIDITKYFATHFQEYLPCRKNLTNWTPIYSSVFTPKYIQINHRAGDMSFFLWTQNQYEIRFQKGWLKHLNVSHLLRNVCTSDLGSKFPFFCECSWDFDIKYLFISKWKYSFQFSKIS